MKLYKLRREQHIPITLDKAWDFFSDPANLGEITPKEMDFKIVHKEGDRMYQGQIIEYNVKPILGIPLSWVTEITHVSDKKFFVDEQRFGPYSFWHHEHHFEEKDGGVLMTDILYYRVPLGILGKFANWLFVRRQLDQIFNFRIDAVNKYFDIKTA